MQVDGFHIVFLCHRFRRRARLFLDSLKGQQSCPYTLHLTAFYTEEADGAFLHESLDGVVFNSNFPMSVDIHEIPQHRIMERSVLFSSITPADGCSHVIYTDCDLWFPQRFFFWYGLQLQKMPKGYWSAYVYEVPNHLAEELVAIDRPTGIEFETRRYEEFRYTDINGRAGHFQCVPKELAKYPAHRLSSVSKVDYWFAQWAIEHSDSDRHERRLEHTEPLYHLGHPYCWEGTDKQL